MKRPKLTLTLSYIVAAILVVLPFHAFLTVWLSSELGHYTLLRLWKEILLAVISGGSVYLLYKDNVLRKRFFASRLIQLILLYCLLSLVWGFTAYGLHKVTPKALGYGLVINLRFLIFFLATWVIAAKDSWLKEKCLKIILWPAVVVVIVGLLQRLVLPYDFLKHFGYNNSTIYPYETINHNVHYVRVMSTLRGANPLGAYLVLVLSYVAVGVAKVKANRRLWMAFGIATFWVLIFSYSRGAWVGLLASFMAIGFLSIRNMRTKRLLLIALGLVILIGGSLAFTLRNNLAFENAFLHTDNHSAIKVSSNQGHVSALKAGLHDLAHEPLGRGVGTAGPASVYNKKQSRIAENYFIQIAQELGWLGVALFIVISYLIARGLWLRRSDNLATALLASLVGITFINFVSHAWADDTLAYIWWGLAGIALAPAILTGKDKQNVSAKKT
jgi:hypothetical protein